MAARQGLLTFTGSTALTHSADGGMTDWLTMVLLACCSAHVYELKHEDGRTPTFTLYRCKLDTGDYRWYISIVPQNQMPGTQQDKDFYYAYCKREHHPPPIRPNSIPLLVP